MPYAGITPPDFFTRPRLPLIQKSDSTLLAWALDNPPPFTFPLASVLPRRASWHIRHVLRGKSPFFFFFFPSGDHPPSSGQILPSYFGDVLPGVFVLRVSLTAMSAPTCGLLACLSSALRPNTPQVSFCCPLRFLFNPFSTIHRKSRLTRTVVSNGPPFVALKFEQTARGSGAL